MKPALLENIVYTTAKHTGVFTDTLLIAEAFGRKHKNVLAILQRHLKSGSIVGLNIKPNSYTTKNNRTAKMYQLDRKAFIVLALSFTGPDADRLKGKFVDLFLSQETELKYWRTERESIKQPTKARNELLEKLSDQLKEQDRQRLLKEDGKPSRKGPLLYLHTSNAIKIAVYGTIKRDRDTATYEELKRLEDMEEFTQFMTAFSLAKYDSALEARERVLSALIQDEELL